MQAIIPSGAFFPKTADGYLENPCAHDLIDQRYRPILDEVVSTYIEKEGTNLHSIYLRGSVPRGMAKGNCDLDTFALVHAEGDRWRTPDWASSIQGKLKIAYPFLSEAEIYLASYTPVLNSFLIEDKKNGLPTNSNLAMIIKTQSLCLHGTDISPQIPRYKVDVNVMLARRWLAQDLVDFKANKKNLQLRQQLLKTILRSGFELVMPRIQEYTPDLYLCYKSFSDFYPEKEAEMRRVLTSFLNPDQEWNIQEEGLLLRFGTWLSEQFKK